MIPPTAARSVPYHADCVRDANQVMLRVSGRLIEPTTPQGWRTCLQPLASADVRVDLGSVTEIDARGLGMLAELTREARASGGRVAVVSASPRVRQLLKLTRLDSLLAAASGPKLAA